MRFLNPAGLWLALIIPPIIALYLLKPRYQEKLVSSTWLWEQAIRDIEASSPWQRLRRNLLLLLQLLAALVLVVTVMRPSLELPGTAGRHLIVILDCSASMQATDVKPDRLTLARRQIIELVDSLNGNETMTLISMTDQPQVLVSATSDKIQLRQAVAGAQASYSQAALEPALSLADALSERDPQARLIIFSDGRTVPLGNGVKLGCPASFRLIGESDDNLAITLLSARQTGNSTIALARLQNFGSAARKSELQLWADKRLYDARTVSLAAGEARDISWSDLPADQKLWQARLVRRDYFMEDNQAYTVVGADPLRRVLLVSSGNIFLEKSISLVPDIQLFKTTPANYNNAMRDYQLYIFDGFLPAALPCGALMVLNPPAGNRLIPVNGELEHISGVQDIPGDVVLRYVDTNGWQIRKSQAITVPAWGKTLLEYQGQPLWIKGEIKGRKVAAAAFDLHNSNIPLQMGFPILIQNLCQWLLPQEVSAPILDDSGQGINFIPPADSESLQLITPRGEELSYAAPLPQHYAISGPGLYRIITRGGGERHEYYLVKNGGDHLESNIGPQNLKELGSAPPRQSTSKGVNHRDLWPWLTAVALILLFLEWEVYRRGY